MRNWLQRTAAEAGGRLRAGYRQTLAFAAIGTLAERLIAAPQWLARLRQGQLADAGVVFMHETLACACAALVISFAVRLCIARGAELVRRPARFLLLLGAGTSAATLLTFSIRAMLDGTALAAAPAQLILDFWMETLLWGGLLGWLYLLALQRAEDQLALTGLQARRATLARQLAQARLGTARARIDPAMVARVLAEAQQRYRDNPAAGAALLDQLISDLRIALSRNRRGAIINSEGAHHVDNPA